MSTLSNHGIMIDLAHLDYQQQMEEIKNAYDEAQQIAKKSRNQSAQQKKAQLPVQPQKQKQTVLAHFSREINSFYGDFYLTDPGTLKIILTSQLDAALYQLVLNKQSKRQHEELNFFETIEEIYEYLLENTQQENKSEKQTLVDIDQTGKISIKVISTIGKKQRQRTIFLQTGKVQQNKEIYLENVVKKIGKSVLELRKQLHIIKEKQEKASLFNKELLLKLKEYGNRIHLSIDRSDSHYSKFKQMEKKVTKAIDNTTYFSLFGDTPLPKNENSYFNIKLGLNFSKNIMVGVASKFTKGIPNVYSHQDFIGFYVYGECYVWEKSNQRDLHLKNYPIQQGTTITTNVNMSHGYVSWQICGVRVAYAVLPLQLKAKQLFPVILMINVNDFIQIDP